MQGLLFRNNFTSPTHVLKNAKYFDYSRFSEKIIRDYPVIHGISMQTGSAFLGTEDHDIAYMELHLRDFKSLGLFFSPQIFESRFESYYQNEDYSSLSRNLNPGVECS
ncbi:104_t:CDS:2 [Funneliformis geosporum]|uniref:104_t:CDS:1 n=1 Tax=Funneliformis geosporum TaxID=1117311 RepID=A0A9W4T2W0_9GLOM|nr:104_t:CDS:2 [Funneliformis geosporum]